MELGTPELLIILVIVLLLFGPGKLVSLGRELGSGIREFRNGLAGSEENDETRENDSKENEDA